ncbi:hypothetical protein [Streptomyces sp. NPDC047981]|uniref:hypothetical protein n=1 Tax=Streptomyces sp. NPDC047981 TaxID=3154610 RepID=UPI0034334412
MTPPFEWTGLAPALTSVVIPGLAAAVHLAVQLYLDRRRPRGGTERPAADQRDAAGSSPRDPGPAGAAAHVTVEVVLAPAPDPAGRPSSAKERAPW